MTTTIGSVRLAGFVGFGFGDDDHRRANQPIARHVPGLDLGDINHIREVVPWFKSSYQLRMNDKRQTEIPVSRAQTKRLRELFNL